MTLGFYARKGYTKHIPQHCLNLDPPILLSHAKQERISKLLSKAKIGVIFLDSDNGVQIRFFSSSVHLSGIRIKLQDTHIIFSFDLTYPFSDSRGTTRSGTTISLHLLLSQAMFTPRTLSSHQSFCSSPSFLSQYEELPLLLTEANACVHRTE